MENFNIKRFLSAKLCYVLCVLISCKFGMPSLKIQFREFHEIEGKERRRRQQRETFQIRPFSFGKYPKFSKACQWFPGICFNIVAAFEALECYRSECLRASHRLQNSPKISSGPKPKFESINAAKTFDWSSRNFHRKRSKNLLRLIGFRSGFENVSRPNPLGSSNRPHLISWKFLFQNCLQFPEVWSLARRFDSSISIGCSSLWFMKILNYNSCRRRRRRWRHDQL